MVDKVHTLNISKYPPLVELRSLKSMMQQFIWTGGHRSEAAGNRLTATFRQDGAKSCKILLLRYCDNIAVF